MTGPFRIAGVLAALTALTIVAQAAPDPAATGKAGEKNAKTAPQAAAKKPAKTDKAQAAKPKSGKDTKTAKGPKGAANAAKKPAAKPAPARTAARTASSIAPAKTPLPKPRPLHVAAVAGATARGHLLPPPSANPAGATVTLASAPAHVDPTRGALPEAASPPTAAELSIAKQAIALIRKGKIAEADALQAGVRDRAIRKMIEWAILRSDDNEVTAARYSAFIAANPNWATVRMFRRRAENLLWVERPNPDTVRRFFAAAAPSTAKGRLTLARALLAQGDRAGALPLIRETWRYDEMSADLETQVLEVFGDLVTRADHKARMDRRLYAEDTEAALRAAKRLGALEMAVAKARISLINREDKAAALLEALPSEARNDAGVIYAKCVVLRRKDRIAEAAQLMLAASRDPQVLMDTDEWWVERRLLARKLLDISEPQTAYQIVRDAAPPTKENYRAEHEFTAGWIALRFLDKPSAALGHFARVGNGTTNPITLARASYWQARALEALGRTGEARSHYEAAARYPTAYYGQVARGRLGIAEVGLRRPPHPEGAQLHAIRNSDIVRAVEILYAIGERDLVYPTVADLGDRAVDVGALVVIAEIAQHNQDARALLLAGKAMLSRGYAFDKYAFPTVGVPSFAAIGPEVDRSVVYAIVRQESAFNQRTVSTANALGLMQVTPAAGRYVARKFGVAFDQKRLLSDPTYNAQMGAAELGDLLKDYRGSYILTFAGYNAGRGRVSEWIKRFGDPRDPDVDPIDWVERIPFSETRNYVQRVMENMQVYRARFGNGGKLLIEADLRRGANGL